MKIPRAFYGKREQNLFDFAFLPHPYPPVEGKLRRCKAPSAGYSLTEEKIIV
jgi:hypothetical protein